MSPFSVTVQVGDAQGRHFEPLEALVDTGATFTVIPRPVLEGLGVAPAGHERFAFADGRVLELDVGIVTVRLDGKERPTICVFGEPGAEALLGAVTLEEFLLAADPVNRTLIPVTGRLMAIRDVVRWVAAKMGGIYTRRRSRAQRRRQRRKQEPSRQYWEESPSDPGTWRHPPPRYLG